MTFLLVMLNILVLCLLTACAQSGSIIGKGYHQRSFLNFSGKFDNIRNLAFDENSSTLYVGGRNILLAVKEEDFNLIRNFSIETYCGDASCSNESLVLEVFTTNNGAFLLSCATPFGNCQKRSLTDLTDLNPSLVQKNPIVSSIVNSNVAKLVKTSNNEEILFFARNYSFFPDRAFFYHPILAVNPDSTDRLFSSIPTMSIRMVDAFYLKYPIDFKAIVESDNFVYFLSNQNSSTKISKICKHSPSEKLAYEDMFLTCSKEHTKFPFVKDAVMWKEDGQFVLITLFTLHQESDNPRDEGAICVFSEDEILEHFLQSRRQRFKCDENQDLDEKDVIFNGVKREISRGCIDISGALGDHNASMHDVDFCAGNSDIPDEGLERIIGFHTLPGKANFVLRGSPTNLTSRRISNTGSFYVGDSTGTVRQFAIEAERDGTYHVNEVNTFYIGVREKVMDMVVSKDNLFVATQRRIVKISGDNCSEFKTCNSCMASGISKCGWCVMKNECTESGTENCRFYGRHNHWLPTIKKKCLKIVFTNGPRQPLSGVSSFKPELQLSPMISTTNISFWCSLDGRPKSPLNFAQSVGKCEISVLGVRGLTHLTEGRKSFEIVASPNGSNADVNIATSDFDIYNCSSYNTCIDCLSQQCSWNRNNLLCSSARSFSNKSECPYIKGNQNVKIAYNKTSSLIFEAAHLQNMSDFHYTCRIRGQTFTAVSNASNSIVCKNVTINGEENITNLTVTFVYRRDNTEEVLIDILSDLKKGHAHVEAYTCTPMLGRFASKRTNDCSSCEYLSTQGYECGWCGSSSTCTSRGCSSVTGACGPPELIDITPDTGPIQGGTRVTIRGINLGMNSMDLNITIGGQPCSDVMFDDSRRVVCTTGQISGSESVDVVLQRRGDNGVMENGRLPSSFHYQSVGNISLLEPRKGIRSGKATVTFEGQFIDQRAKIKFIGEKTTLDCVLLPTRSRGKVRCLSPIVDDDAIGTYNITVMYDGVNVTLEDTYEIISDPEIIKPSKLQSIRSGGLELRISGKPENPFDFGILSRKILKVGNGNQACEMKRNVQNAIFCTYPPLNLSSSSRRRKRNAGQEAAFLELDGWSEFLGYVTYFDDPKFRNLTKVFEYDPTHGESVLELGGENLNIVTSNPDHYNVYIGSGLCHSENLTSSILTCEPPEKEPSPWRGEKKLVIRVEIGFKQVVVGEAKYITEFQWLIAVIAALGVLVLVTIIVMTIIVYRVRRRSKKREHEILMEMQRMEDDLREEGRDEFATMQLTITNIKTDLVSTGIPFNAYDIYVMKILFPTSEHETINKTLLHKDLVPSKSMRTAMDQFEGLLRNRFFVRCLIGSLERQKKITMQDKAQLSSLFTLVFLGRMKDFYEIVKCLLENLVDSTPKKQHRVIFNRIENITLRLLINWLYIALFPHFKDGGGTSLFMLYKAILTVVEKRPVDCVTGDAKNTLSQHRFLRCKVDFNIMTLTIDLNGDGHEFSCEVLDCDTISQVKQKCLRQIYKNRPASQMPSTDELILEWKMGHGKLALNDFDHTSVREGNKIQMNTLKHYNVKDKSNMELHYKFSPPNPDGNEPEETYENFVKQPSSPNEVMLQMPTLVTEESLERMERWHLDEVVEESTPDDTNITARHLKEEKGMHITSLMHTKLILQEYIRTLLDQILDENIQSIVHYVFGTLNTIAESKGVDPDVLQCWKSESYAIRIWASLVATPDILFDVDRPKHIEPSLDSIRQLIIDCFHNTKITKDSSLQKLLFATEVPEYQKKIDIFYKRLSQLECIGEGQFANEMTKLSNMQQSSFDFKKLPVLLKIYKFIQSYIEDVLEDLDDDEDAKSLDLRAKLETVIEQMDQDE